MKIGQVNLTTFYRCQNCGEQVVVPDKDAVVEIAHPQLTFTPAELATVRVVPVESFAIIDGVELFGVCALLDATYGPRWYEAGSGYQEPSPEAEAAAGRYNAQVAEYRKTLKPGDFISDLHPRYVETARLYEGWAKANGAIIYSYGSDDRAICRGEAVKRARAAGVTRVLMEDLS